MDIDQILNGIQKPARYTGGEYNSVRKDWRACDVRICLSYPDIYEIGMSHQGLQILYHLINMESGVLCERAFAPWPDMEKRLKEKGVQLFSLESRKPLRDFDIVGFSLGYELTYTNMLNMLDLGGVPIFSKERGNSAPIVIAGGPCCFNPAPLSELVDIFFVGDAEESIHEFLRLYRRLKAESAPRDEILAECSAIAGLYIPLYHKKNHSVKKRIVLNLEESFYPTNPIVPFIRTIHDRVAVEIMRGCPNACRFCQARAIYNPLRLRSRNKIVQLATAALKNTGYEEVSFLSLSSSNHPDLIGIVDDINSAFSGKGINISVPSLRIEDLCADLPSRIAKNRKTGLTFAPEAGSENLRKMIGKRIEVDKLLEAARGAFKNGWRKIKLYFMIGLPGETNKDLDEIGNLARQVSFLRKEIGGKKAEVTLSINNFIPKPHTSFEHLGIEGEDKLKDKQLYLKSIVRERSIKLDFQDTKLSILESALSRGDKSLNKVVCKAWEHGARLDAWRDFFNLHAWEQAFRDCGMSLTEAAELEYGPNDILPWNFIDTVMPPLRTSKPR